MTPIECFLHRVFPSGIYDETATDIIQDRIFKPRADCQPVHLPKKIDWEALDRSTDRNWRMQLQGWTMFHPVLNFFDEYADKRSALDFFFSIAADWGAAYGSDPDDVVTSRMPASYAWYDMSVGFRALIIAFFVDRINTYGLKISRDEQELLRELVRKHIANLSEPSTFSLNNHGIFQAHGLMALLETSGIELAESRRQYAANLMSQLIETQFDKFGVHLEHSPHYHFYVLKSFDGVIKSGWYDQHASVVDRISLARAACRWLVDPLKRPVCVGDSILTVQKSVDFNIEGTDAPFVVSDFGPSGYAVVRSNWNVAAEDASMLFLMAAYHRTTHKHRDCLSFDWFDQGQRIICDSGKYGYVSDKYRHYCLSSRAHNSVEIEGFDILKMAPYGSALEDVVEIEPGVFRLTAKLSYKAITHLRTIYFCPGSWVVIEDNLSYAKERNSTQWFHMETDYDVTSCADTTVSLKGSGERRLYVECLDKSVDLVIFRGDEDAMQGFVSKKDQQIEPGIAIGFKTFGKKHCLRTVLALSKDARLRATEFLSEKLGVEVGDSSIRTNGEQTRAESSLLPNVPHWVSDDIQRLQLKRGPNSYSTRIGGVRYNLFFDNKGKGKLLVLLPGAANRSKGHIDFQRHAWSADFPEHDILAISDPTIKQHNIINLAWFQNTEERYGIDSLHGLIAEIANIQNYPDAEVTLFGSSGGGFTALQLAKYMPSSTVIAINPQIHLEKYTRSFFERMLSVCYPGLSAEQVKSQYPDRLSVVFPVEARKANAYIFQNIHDHLHVDLHVKPFVASFEDEHVSIYEDQLHDVPSSRLVNVVYFADEAAGHSPPSKEKTLEMLAPILK